MILYALMAYLPPIMFGVVLGTYIVSFARFARNSQQWQSAIRSTADTRSKMQNFGAFARLWRVTKSPNSFFVNNGQDAPFIAIFGIFILLSFISSGARLLSKRELGAPTNLFSALEGFGMQFLLNPLKSFAFIALNLLVTVLIIQGVAKIKNRSGSIAGYTMSPAIFTGMVDAAIAVLSVFVPPLKLFTLFESIPPLVGLSVATLGTTLLAIWIGLPIFLSFRIFYAGIVSEVPERATAATWFYLLAVIGLGIGLILL